MRLIDADKLKKVGLKLPFDGFNKTWLNNDDIDRQPTVDAVEVVRCKDCWNCEIEECNADMRYY